MNKDTATLVDKLKTAGVQDSEYTWYGLIVGMICAGLEEGSHNLVKLCQTLLNDDEPLPGLLTAAITSVSLEVADSIRQSKKQELLQLPGAEVSTTARLQALSDLVSGLELGLSCDKKTGRMQSTISNPDLLEILKVFNEISQVDPEADFDEDSFSEVTSYICSALLAQFKDQA